jgi:hypothetical protein
MTPKRKRKSQTPKTKIKRRDNTKKANNASMQKLITLARNKPWHFLFNIKEFAVSFQLTSLCLTAPVQHIMKLEKFSSVKVQVLSIGLTPKQICSTTHPLDIL